MEIAMLNAMASDHFETSLDLQRQWGIRVLDLKDGIFGKSILELKDGEVEKAASAIEERGLSVHCLTTDIFKTAFELGGREFLRVHRQSVQRVLELASRLRPAAIRVLTPRLENRAEIEDAPFYLYKEARWLFEIIRETADRLADVGVSLCIENEPDNSVFSRPDEVVQFFALLGRPGLVSFTYDVQNLWQMGTFPSLDVYREMKSVIGYLHVKGGIADSATGRLKWRSTLERASWPVDEIIREAVRDKTVPVICLNPSHGIAADRTDSDDPVRADLAYVRQLIADSSPIERREGS